MDGFCYYTDGEPAGVLMEHFSDRSDHQITNLEILAVSVGLCTFCDCLRGRKVVVFSDNRGAEVSVLARERLSMPIVSLSGICAKRLLSCVGSVCNDTRNLERGESSLLAWVSACT